MRRLRRGRPVSNLAVPHFSHEATRLYYEDRGEGPPLLLLAGLGMLVAHWKGQLDILRLSKQFRVICLENRGIGKSDAPAGPYSVRDFAEDARALLDHLGIEKCRVVGHSMGGFAAQALAAHHPERVARVVLACSGKQLPPAGRERLKLGVQMRKEGVSRGLRIRIAFSWFYDASLYEDRMTAQLWADAAQLPPEPNLEGFEAQVAACLDHDSTPWLNKIVAPCLVLAGENDQIFPAAGAAAFAEELAQGELHLVKACGHTPFGKSAEAFTSAIRRFLA